MNEHGNGVLHVGNAYKNIVFPAGFCLLLHLFATYYFTAAVCVQVVFLIKPSLLIRALRILSLSLTFDFIFFSRKRLCVVS